MSLVLALVLAIASQAAAQSPLSDWMPGVATNYGGPSEGMDPNTPSYGLSNVSLTLLDVCMHAFFCARLPRPCIQAHLNHSWHVTAHTPCSANCTAA